MAASSRGGLRCGSRPATGAATRAARRRARMPRPGLSSNQVRSQLIDPQSRTWGWVAVPAMATALRWKALDPANVTRGTPQCKRGQRLASTPTLETWSACSQDRLPSPAAAPAVMVSDEEMTLPAASSP